MTKNKLTDEEKAEVKVRERHKPMNDAIRAGRGDTVSVGSGVPEANVKMGSYIRKSAGRVNGKAEHDIGVMKRAAVSRGFYVDDTGKITHDARTKKERAEQETWDPIPGVEVDDGD